MIQPLVSVLTPSIPERGSFLRECQASVKSQTVDGWEHLVEIDENREGCAVVMNRLASQAQGLWLLPLADDDLLLPGCFETFLTTDSLLPPGADGGPVVIYSPPLVTGNEDRWWFYQAPPVIPSCALVHRAVWEKFGGYDASLTREEDRDLWIKILDWGGPAMFRRVDDPTWVYRQHQGNKSMQVAA